MVVIRDVAHWHRNGKGVSVYVPGRVGSDGRVRWEEGLREYCGCRCPLPETLEELLRCIVGES